jgi:hypothetical protein
MDLVDAVVPVVTFLALALADPRFGERLRADLGYRE